MNYDIIIIGAGAAGLMAASSINSNLKTVILEKNNQPGKKLLATGTGKCNYTVHGDINYLLNGFPKYQQIFLKHSFYQFSPKHTINFFKELNIKRKIFYKEFCKIVEKEFKNCIFRQGRNSSYVNDKAYYNKVFGGFNRDGSLNYLHMFQLTFNGDTFFRYNR
jgi:flavin-dependent dehydrogenase